MQDSKPFVKSRIWMVGLVTVIAGISAVLLTAINIYTRPMIALNEEIKLKKSVLAVFSIPYEEDRVVETFDAAVKVRDADGGTFYEYYDNGRPAGIAFEAGGAGFWGPISALVALTPDLETVMGIEILHQEETPGLGGRIVEDKFKNQFKGRGAGGEIAVDAITGATMTSKAFKRIINKDVRSFREGFAN